MAVIPDNDGGEEETLTRRHAARLLCVFILFLWVIPPAPAAPGGAVSPDDSPILGRLTASLSVSPVRAFFVPQDEVPLNVAFHVYSGTTAIPYLAFGTPASGLLFYDGETGALHGGVAGDSSTWTPFHSTAISLPSGLYDMDITISAGGFTTPGIYTVYAGLLDPYTGSPVSTIGRSHFTVYNNRAVIVGDPVHVGDHYEPYMAGWEEPWPEGVSVNRFFFLEKQPEGDVGLQGEYFATYYSNNPVYLDGSLLGYLPGEMNGNVWRWAAASISPERFYQGTNVMTFTSGRHPATGHYDDYMVRWVAVYYN